MNPITLTQATTLSTALTPKDSFSKYKMPRTMLTWRCTRTSKDTTTPTNKQRPYLLRRQAGMATLSSQYASTCSQSAICNNSSSKTPTIRRVLRHPMTASPASTTRPATPPATPARCTAQADLVVSTVVAVASQAAATSIQVISEKNSLGRLKALATFVLAQRAIIDLQAVMARPDWSCQAAAFSGPAQLAATVDRVQRATIIVESVR